MASYNTVPAPAAEEPLLQEPIKKSSRKYVVLGAALASFALGALAVTATSPEVASTGMTSKLFGDHMWGGYNLKPSKDSCYGPKDLISANGNEEPHTCNDANCKWIYSHKCVPKKCHAGQNQWTKKGSKIACGDAPCKPGWFCNFDSWGPTCEKCNGNPEHTGCTHIGLPHPGVAECFACCT